MRTGLRTINIDDLGVYVSTRLRVNILCLCGLKLRLCWGRLRLLGQSPEQQRPSGLQNKAKIQEWRPGENVLQIESGFLFRGMLLTKAMDLGESRYTAVNLQPLSLPVRVVFGSLSGLRSRTNERHVPAQDVPELGQLGQAPPDKESLVELRIGCVTLHVQTIHLKRDSVLPTTQFSPK